MKQALDPELRLRRLLERQAELRRAVFEGPVPTWDVFLRMRGRDEELCTAIAEVRREIRGDGEDEG